MKKELILGLAVGYSWQHVRAFVCSLRETGYKGDVVLFVSPNLDDETADFYDKNAISYIKFDEGSPYLAGIPPEIISAMPNFLSIIPTSVYRILLSLNFLRENEGKYSNVMLSDIRDVVFQDDPFDFEIKDTLCFFMEPKFLKLKNEDLNAVWVIDAFGLEVFYEISDNFISCFGTTIGPISKIINYLEILVSYLIDIGLKRRLTWGVEQGVHNYVIIKRKIEDFSLFFTEDGPIATVAKLPNIGRDAAGNCINQNGRKYNVVHQYDRLPELSDFFNTKFERASLQISAS